MTQASSFADDWPVERSFALIQEIQNSVKLVEAGIAEVHRRGASNDFTAAALLLLSHGLERLIKVTLVTSRLAQGLPVPTANEIRKTLGHDISAALAELQQLAARVPEYSARPIVVEDQNFLASDSELHLYLELLSKFGKHDRYFDLEVILDPSKSDPDSEPSRVWSEIETSVVTGREDLLELVGGPDSASLHVEINKAIASVFDRLLRAIARMWNLGACGDDGRSMATGAFGAIASLDDTELGVAR